MFGHLLRLGISKPVITFIKLFYDKQNILSNLQKYSTIKRFKSTLKGLLYK